MADQRLNIIFSGDASQLNKTIDQLEQELKGFQSQLKGTLGANEFQKLNQSIAATKAQMTALRAAGSGLSSSVVGANGALRGFSQSSNSATQSMINLGRVVQDAPFGFLGIANNLNPLLESFQRLKATTGSTGGALKALSSSLLGAGGLGFALSIVSSLLIVFGDKLFGTKKGLSDAEIEARKFRDSINDIKTSVDNLFSSLALGDKLKKLTNELRSPGQADILNLGIDKEALERNFNLAGEEVAKSTKRIQRVVSDAALLLSKEGSNLLIKYRDVLQTGGSVPDDLIDKLSKSDKKIFDRLNEDAARIDAFESQRQKARERIGELDLETQIKIAAKQKQQREQDIKDYEKFVDETIARAKQFAKEFGEVVVTPNFEDGFFKSKEELFKTANKFLGDIGRGVFKLKIPVSVEPVFLPVPQESEPSERFFDQLKKSFEQGGELDLSIPIKGTIKGIDEAIRGFVSFGDAGVREFLRVSKAGENLSEAFKSFQTQMKATEDIQLGVALAIGSAFESMFDSLGKGTNSIKAFFDALTNSVKALIGRLIAAAAAAAILNAISGGSFAGAKGFGGIFKLLLSGGSIASPSAFGSGRSQAFQNTLVATVRGTDLAFVLQQGQNSIGRVR